MHIGESGSVVGYTSGCGLVRFDSCSYPIGSVRRSRAAFGQMCFSFLIFLNSFNLDPFPTQTKAMDYRIPDAHRLLIPGFQLPPPPPIDRFRHHSDKLWHGYSSSRPDPPKIHKSLSDVVAEGPNWCLSESRSHWACSTYWFVPGPNDQPLIVEGVRSKSIEALDLAFRVNKPDRLGINSDLRCDRLLSTTIDDQAACFYQPPSKNRAFEVEAEASLADASPQSLKRNQCDVCCEGTQDSRIKQSLHQVSEFYKPRRSKGRDGSLFREFPRTVSSRDHRRLRTVVPLPVIREVETTSSDDDEDAKDTKIETSEDGPMLPIMMECPSPGTTSTSVGSLLDRMHRRYCASQYKRTHATGDSHGDQGESEKHQGNKTPPRPPRLKLGTSFFPDAPRGTQPWVDSPAIIISYDLNSEEKASPDAYPFCLSSQASLSPSSPVSPSSISSIDSPLFSPISPRGWFDRGWGSTRAAPTDPWSTELNDHPDSSLEICDGQTSPLPDCEVEAVEACEWLRDAGFPQYAQMYKDNQFPIDLKAAERDHDFLDEDAIHAVFRRLEILNKCSSSKLKRSPVRKNFHESDDDDECALSNKWTFQRNSRIWSRNGTDEFSYVVDHPETLVEEILLSMNNGDSVLNESVVGLCTSDPQALVPVKVDDCVTSASVSLEPPENQVVLKPNVDQTNGSEVAKAMKLKRPNLFSPNLSSSLENEVGALPVEDTTSLMNNNKGDVISRLIKDFPEPSSHSTDTENAPPSPHTLSPPGLRRGSTASEKVRGALGFLWRMDGIKMRRISHKRSKGELKKQDIGKPVLIESPEILLKMDALNCTDIVSSDDKTNNFVVPTYEKSISLEAAKPRTRLGDTLQSSIESVNIPVISKTRSPKSQNQQAAVKSADEEASVKYTDSSFSCSDASVSPSPEIYRRSHSLDGENKIFEEAIDIVSELLRSVNAEIPTSGNNKKRMSMYDKKRISVYDNVSPEVTSALHNELDQLLTELYKNIDSLDYSISKVDRIDKKAMSPTSSVTTIDEEDAAKAPGKSKLSLVAVDSLDGCDSTDGNMSTSPSNGSYILDHTAANVEISAPDPVQLFIDEAIVTVNGGGDKGGGGGDNLFPAVDEPKTVRLNIPSDLDSADSSSEQKEDDWSYPTRENGRERRDSGVGYSLTRTTSSKRQKRPRLRWHSFAKCHQLSLNSCDQPISNLSAGQMAVLRKLSLLKVTAALEKYSPANRANWSWFVPRLRRRTKMPDYSERNVFGIPIAVTQQRQGQPLPQCILYALRRLRRCASDSIGIFRRPGVRTRVQTLREALESDPDSIDYEGLQAYDVADLLKLYFRELPECLLTNKLSHVFISIFLYVPVDSRPELLRMTILLLPDEHRQTLQSLLLFLSDMAQHSETNQMTASNLAVCFAPSLFQLGSSKSSHASSPKQRRAGMPSDKDLLEQKVAHECLTYMITNAKKIFTVSEEMLSMCQLSYLEQGNPVPLEELCRKYGKCDNSDYTSYVDSCIQGVLKESRDKFKGWISQVTPGGDVDLAYKKVGDGHPLRLWKYFVEVEAPPEEVLNRVLRERHLWDDDILKWRVVEKLDRQTEVFQYVLNSMVPHPTQDFAELRAWRTNLTRGTCVLISTSVEHANAPLMGDVRCVVLASRYLIEPCGSGKSRLTHIVRIDLRGHSPDWYNSIYCHICANYARRIRDSFKTSAALSRGPETKV